MKAAKFLLPLAFFATAAHAQNKYDSAVNVALDGTITGGTAITNSDDPAVATQQVREQLRYAIGQLNGMSGGVDSSRLVITLGAGEMRDDGRWTFTYDAALRLSWPRSMQIPASYELVLPASGDDTGRQEFMRTFGNDSNSARRCLADDAHDLGVGSFWYYYRPYKTTCTIARSRSPLLVRIPVELTLSSTNTQGKAPEYGKVWEDGKLVVTAVFSKYEAGGMDSNDAGVATFQSFYASLRQTFGVPVTTSLGRGEQPSAYTPIVRSTYRSSRGTVDVVMFLVDSVDGGGQAFRDEYNTRTETSDFVAYNGHAGLGANVEALSRLGHFLPGQYQVFLLNGCDTFSYAHQALLEAHQAANPDQDASKYVDVITNARPALFNQMVNGTLSVMRAMIGKTKTYRQILAEVDASQRAGVTGEEDNRWPQPFDDVLVP